MFLGYEFSDIFTIGNLLYTGIVGILTWWLKDRIFQKQQLRAGDIANEIQEAEQGLKEVELLKETITVYKDVNSDLKTDLLEAKTIIKELKSESKRYDELEAKVNDLFLKLATETEKSQFLLKENTDLKIKLETLEKDYEELKSFCDKLKKELDTHKRTTK